MDSRAGGAVERYPETRIQEGKMASVEQVQGSETTAEEVVNTVVEEGARLGVKRFFTIPGRDPFDEIEWETRDALIPGRDGPAFEQRAVEFPKFWSQTATNIVAQKVLGALQCRANKLTSLIHAAEISFDQSGKGLLLRGSFFAALVAGGIFRLFE